MPDNPDAPETEPVEEATPQAEPKKPEQLPDDHPLVKTLAAQKDEIKALKAKASRLDEIEEAKKSEAEKVAERIANAEAEVASVPQKVTDALKGHLVEIHKISDEDAELFLTATEPELLLKQVARLVQAAPQGPKPNPQQGQPSRGRGGTLSAGRERYTATHK